MGVSISEDTKRAVLVIIFKGTRNPIDTVRYLEGISKIERFLRGNGGKTSWWSIVVSKRWRTWSNKACCLSS